MDRSSDFGKSEFGVEGYAVVVIEFGVARDFIEAAGDGPLFDVVYQALTDAEIAVGWKDEPSFEVGNGR